MITHHRTLPVVLALLAGCATSTTPTSSVPDPFFDLDPDPGVFEAVLTARQANIDIDGEVVSMLTYGGVLPGPEIRVTEGDRVVIHLQNELAQDYPTTIHWHGIEGTNAADGTPTTQKPVESGDSFTYDFRVPRAGIYWFHPHVRGAQATFSGLYAPLIVDDPDLDELVDAGVLPATLKTVVLSDVSSFRGEVLSVEGDDATDIMNGIEGEQLLVNGEVMPVIEAPAGEGIRLQLINTSITRFWRLSVPGHTLLKVGGQNGLLDHVVVEGGVISGEAEHEDGTVAAVDIDTGYARGEILLAPAERADVVLMLNGEVGTEVELRWEDWARGRHGMWMDGDEMIMADAEDDGTRPGVDVATFRVTAGGGTSYSLAEGDPVLAAVGRSVEVLSTDGVSVDFTGAARTELQELMEMDQDASGTWVMSSEFFIDDEAWTPSLDGPTQSTAPTARHARIGDRLSWEVHNSTAMAHPFHLHGFSFQVTEMVRDEAEAHEEGEDTSEGPMTTRWQPAAPEWMDTVNIPPFTSAMLVVDVSDPNGDGGALGRWMAHCHIFQHAEEGMMTELIVDP